MKALYEFKFKYIKSKKKPVIFFEELWGTIPQTLKNFIIDSKKYCKGTLKRIFFRSEKNMKFDINNLLKFCLYKQNANLPFVSWTSKFIFTASLSFKNVGLVNTSTKTIKL